MIRKSKTDTHMHIHQTQIFEVSSLRITLLKEHIRLGHTGIYRQVALIIDARLKERTEAIKKRGTGTLKKMHRIFFYENMH